MIDTPEILDIPAQLTARIHLGVPSSEIMSHMMPALREVRKALGDQGVAAAGPWFTHHFKIPDQTFDFEICIPVDSAVAPQGRMTPGELQATRLVRTVYRGDYSGLPHGWGEFMAWIKVQDLKVAGDFWEVYSVGADDSSVPADWQTQLNCPLL